MKDFLVHMHKDPADEDGETKPLTTEEKKESRLVRKATISQI